MAGFLVTGRCGRIPVYMCDALTYLIRLGFGSVGLLCLLRRFVVMAFDLE